MNILVIGSGGREHVLTWKIRQSPFVEKIYCAPGNPGMAELAECVDIVVTDFDGLVAFAKERAVEFVIVGPEEPLAKGIVDVFGEAGISAFGPTKDAAILEASKAFTKRLMAEHGIPSAEYAEFTETAAAKAYVREMGAPIVVKADGLAAGKGVTVAPTVAAAEAAIDAMMVEKSFGDAGTRVVIEECLSGEEASILAFTDGERVLPLATSQDHKPVYDGDRGPNTGGMGAYSPAPVVDDAMFGEIRRRILEPCVRAMADEGRPYRGILYAGLMITVDGPKVIEFNCRFGDPEAQVVLPRLKSDIVPIMQACCLGTLEDTRLDYDEGACVTVVMASGGYPYAYEKGRLITGIDEAEARGAIVFHAGTKRLNGDLVTDGGRVLSVTALGDTIPAAIDNAYMAVACIEFQDAYYRRDIGRKVWLRLEGGE